MLYFKHMSNMRNDSRMKRVISRYGLEGYGLYNIVVESIAENISTETPLPDLEETCEDLASFYNGDTARINEIMSYMVNQGLFEISELTGRVLCSKIYKFLQSSQTRSGEIRTLIKNYTQQLQLAYPEASQTVSDMNNGDNGQVSEDVLDSNRPSQTVSDCHSKNRTEQEENRTEENSEGPPLKVWQSLPDLCRDAWFTFEKIHGAFIPNRDKEIDSINRLVFLSEKAGDPGVVVVAMMKKLKELKDEDSTPKGFWRKQPYLPSTLVSLWSRVWEEAKIEAVEEMETEDIPDVGF